MPPTQLHHPSPKRKRDQPPPVPLLTTTLCRATTPPHDNPTPSSGADSPRNAVADQLRGMTLVPIAAIPMSPLDQVAHKKLKLDEMRVDSSMSLNEDHTKMIKSQSWAKSHKLDTIAGTPKLDVSREIPETPQAPRPRILPHITSFAQPTTFTSSSGSPTSQNISSISHGQIIHDPSSSQPRPRNKSPSLPLPSLTWHNSEITGHLADPSTDPDDDGTGLNGIGFKPTPAIAYARSQKRRQQLNEWKARQTREERAKRSERRRRGVGGAASREATVEREMPVKDVDTARRSVKFAL
ncbi:uncharacterized protein K460DRAFT_368845 [Cucurbitaria berberidis CBS 394.84]|uniref:Uncharacterized protein n=1 Tax=Cucurbitaria berberidis CBS 394.84 TaxID=1168544 RepID=A0A9P4GEI2_9PLEO|nr:uncharacterized protein K460DRAFT_368845 [Cucurbitaria berberidis CBS 394.84]KAF1843974.1 hypothetical protein K460DRAFT_368845 [Cucurbitaria berberidis CBS 394.84]